MSFYFRIKISFFFFPPFYSIIVLQLFTVKELTNLPNNPSNSKIESFNNDTIFQYKITNFLQISYYNNNNRKSIVISKKKKCPDIFTNRKIKVGKRSDPLSLTILYYPTHRTRRRSTRK